jgi:DNA-binding NarL/FixJ family response regulator
MAGGDAPAALASLRRSLTIFEDLEIPYEAARARVLVAMACRALGVEDTARLELDAADAAFRALGAAADLARLQMLSPPPAGARDAHGLTPREREVLRLIAAGKSNRAIAAELVISERTVGRHASNIFRTLGVPSRSAATAYAHERGLV